MQKDYFCIWRKIPFPEKDSILLQGFHATHVVLSSVNVAGTNHKTTAPSRSADYEVTFGSTTSTQDFQSV